MPDGGVTPYPAYKPYTLFSCYSRHVFEIHHKIKTRRAAKNDVLLAIFCWRQAK
ncbi:hypothetical protein BN4901_2979 [Citrobacter europaeus]|uniref:Uncharacterized protein n=1 Tax=Citrobacter europaeus TaxID=1914243 RepID=A0ABY0JRB6_9ENTR|nr:hypothetical protein BN4901_2979 [Citrobacter europaeus]